MVTAILFACNNKKTQISNLDSELWKADINGCHGYRKSTIDNNSIDLQQFIGLSEKEVVNLLGKPNETLLYTRAQKFYNYAIEACETKFESKTTIRFRFNALGYINEFIILEE